MSTFSSERSKPWNIYTTPDPTSSQTGAIDREAPWKSFGTSMNAIAFGFVATAILISMFLIMAIFEHLFRPNPSFSSPQGLINRSLQSGPVDKLGNPQTVATTSYAVDFSVLMPGQHCPTYIAQPAPLPCTREGIYWPSHENNNLMFP
ncbi:uncharacterized protein LOC110624585 [Manihot esculenta]|uniref:Uncharacterized protein n=7 Tax=Manihot esculenta TaxID=3983 RepID=A0A251K0J0_MANES|nr:uncharacterized protein LOC110624585 [Manihot esculenta]XP_043816711.1 uncharacterized protein LOC110624585 [Manihot esculenta]XP_043816712.1 uncharacterized protein LOC110624585 [Manihot esculenta]XP_043816713.1 uncharacterized protein LOC110624585 [Manihot esculenta]XP_043816714.1 uncharacterized protein LOC110624585 [Manihot esculenta]KAG8646059.1 hypothetical protein MANES_10G117600v8 [Manihot esculenta]KAG8646060.1 hypothetical protein MANES_10G117600v8 [Manihot esculenta]KAG8646061.